MVKCTCDFTAEEMEAAARSWHRKDCPMRREVTDKPIFKRRNDDALYNSSPLTDGEKMAIGWYSGINQGRKDSMG